MIFVKLHKNPKFQTRAELLHKSTAATEQSLKSMEQELLDNRHRLALFLRQHGSRASEILRDSKQVVQDTHKCLALRQRLRAKGGPGFVFDHVGTGKQVDQDRDGEWISVSLQASGAELRLFTKESIHQLAVATQWVPRTWSSCSTSSEVLLKGMLEKARLTLVEGAEQVDQEDWKKPLSDMADWLDGDETTTSSVVDVSLLAGQNFLVFLNLIPRIVSAKVKELRDSDSDGTSVLAKLQEFLERGILPAIDMEDSLGMCGGEEDDWTEEAGSAGIHDVDDTTEAGAADAEQDGPPPRSVLCRWHNSFAQLRGSYGERSAMLMSARQSFESMRETVEELLQQNLFLDLQGKSGDHVVKQLSAAAAALGMKKKRLTERGCTEPPMMTATKAVRQFMEQGTSKAALTKNLVDSWTAVLLPRSELDALLLNGLHIPIADRLVDLRRAVEEEEDSFTESASGYLSISGGVHLGAARIILGGVIIIATYVSTRIILEFSIVVPNVSFTVP